ncbi:hypothetical protein CR513_45986 [Mucuna pruriens]|uniref:Uncharacterized protein n=1 Tax=Mucuna pruriens TaxID=157652 RepID=A0A371F7M2_MUCPR|nr:hypothetical protein CR513_45986 [Mucuna pruriens]
MDRNLEFQNHKFLLSLTLTKSLAQILLQIVY